MAVTLPSKKQKGKHYISTQRPYLRPDDESLKETNITYNDDLHGVMDGKKVERFSKLKKKLEKKTV
jgi:hypothetical protein